MKRASALVRPALLVDRMGNPLASVKRAKGQPRSKRKIIVRPSAIVRVVRDNSIATDAMLRSGPGGRGSMHGQRSHVPFASKQPTNPAPGPTMAWFSDFRSESGVTDRAYLDGVGAAAKWAGSNFFEGGTPAAQIVAATGLGFPAGTTNVWKNNFEALSTHYRQVFTSGKLVSIPAIGEYAYYRACYRDPRADADDLHQEHPWQVTFDAGTVGAAQGTWHWNTPGTPAAGVYQLHFRFEHQVDPDIRFHVNLSVNHTYMLQLSIQRTSATVGKVRLRVSDIDGGNLFTEADFVADDNVTTLASRNPDLAVTDNSFIYQDLGNNGDAQTTGGFSTYWGNFGYRVSTSSAAWIGPYPVVGAEA